MNATDEKVTPIDEETMASAPFFLKAIVVGLGIAIIAMLGLILFRIVSGPMPEESEPVTAISQPVTAAPSGNFNVPMPEGAELVRMVPAGTEVFLHFRLKGGADQVVILDRATGEISRLWVVPEGQ